MIKPAFDIGSFDEESDSLSLCSLIIEVTEKQFTCALVNKKSSRLLQLRQYDISSESIESRNEFIMNLVAGDSFFKRKVSETVIIYNFIESTLIPGIFFSTEMAKPVMEIVSGNTYKGLALSEKIPGNDIYTIYRIPKEIHSFLQNSFSAGNYWHFNSLIISSIYSREDEAGIVFHLYFYPDKMIAAIFDEKKLQLMQSCFYELPEDLSFYLLNICRQLNFDPEKVQLLISGLIDEDSAMYDEIARYFLQIEWDTKGADALKFDQLTEYPAHYFSPILQMALCV